MCCQVGDASHSITLNLDIRGEHLANKGCQPAQLDNQDFVLSCPRVSTCSKGECTKLRRTVDGEITEGRARSSLNLDIGTL